MRHWIRAVTARLAQAGRKQVAGKGGIGKKVAAQRERHKWKRETC